MAVRRSYGDLCPIARALDLVGERWALLIVRELLLGPQRFTDLRHALPAVSTNILTDRLRELEDRQLIIRRRLPPPAPAVTYELTAHGRGLERILDALGEWGTTAPAPGGEPALSASSMLIFLRGALRESTDLPEGVFNINLDMRPWTLDTHGGAPVISPGEPTAADASIRIDPQALNAVLAAPDTLDAALDSGTASAEGDIASLRRLLGSAHRAAASDEHGP